MKREIFKPVDLAHLEGKALAICDSFRKANDISRSEGYRQFHLNNAEQLANTLLHDFSYYFDEYEIGGIVPYGLDDLPAPDKEGNN